MLLNVSTDNLYDPIIALYEKDFSATFAVEVIDEANVLQ